jgi:hypothetical protein
MILLTKTCSNFLDLLNLQRHSSTTSREENMVLRLAGLRTKNYGAGEGQQRFTQLTDYFFRKLSVNITAFRDVRAYSLVDR